MNYGIGILLAILVCGAALLLRLDRDRRFYTAMLIVVALAAHGTFDFTHHFFFQNRGVPGWYPGFCMTYDVVAAAILAAILTWRKQQGAGTLTILPSPTGTA
jgi:hypothetical protein